MPQTRSQPAADRLQLGNDARPLAARATMVAAIAIGVGLLLALFSAHGVSRFFFAYLVAFCFVLTLSIGGLFFVLLQHMTKAGWSVNVRRVAEWLAASMPAVAVMSLPILLSVLLHNGSLYRWTQPGWGAAQEAPTHVSPKAGTTTHVDSAGPSGVHVSPSKRAYLSPIAFILRIAIYFTVWSMIGGWYWRQSLLQDKSGDYRVTEKMQYYAAPSLVGCGLTVTLAAFDLIMSLDPSWSSTIFGVYFFAGSMLAFFCVGILVVLLLQRQGYLAGSVTVEHYHDMGKFLFAFVFFWGYIAFSQFMLIWYGNIPEETEWFRRRGATTVAADTNGFTIVILLILFGHLLIPFAGLLSRHVKRSTSGLAFWAVWLLAFHYLDLYWLILPEFNSSVHFPLVEICLLVGLAAAFIVVVIGKAQQGALRPLQDPRLPEALAFQNI